MGAVRARVQRPFLYGQLMRAYYAIHSYYCQKSESQNTQLGCKPGLNVAVFTQENSCPEANESKMATARLKADTAAR